MDDDSQVPAPRSAPSSGQAPLAPAATAQVPSAAPDGAPDAHVLTGAEVDPLAAGLRLDAGDAPRVAEISALLAEIDALRTTLTTDLTLAAAALEAGADDLAAEVVGDDLAQLHAFERRALAHLRVADQAPVRLHGRRRLRTRRMLPAAPVLAAAAALIGFVSGAGTGAAPAPSAAPAMTSAAAASWELHRLARTGASTAEIREVAEDLNERLAALVAVAAADPAAAQQALLLLDDTAQVLRTAEEPGALADVLAETRALAARLAQVLPRALSPQARATRPVVVPRLPVAEEQPRREYTRTTAPSAPSSPAPTPASPTASPSPATTPAPAPQPSAQPEPSPTQGPAEEPILPRPGDLPAF